MGPRETTTRRAYRAGFRAGSIADVGGTPLSAYRYPGLVQAYHDGFADAQTFKGEITQDDALMQTANMPDDLR
ncbi:MAG: hypothetical protein ACRD3G_11495 [Vicinamibacterales bacterium]